MKGLEKRLRAAEHAASEERAAGTVIVYKDEEDLERQLAQSNAKIVFLLPDNGRDD